VIGKPISRVSEHDLQVLSAPRTPNAFQQVTDIFAGLFVGLEKTLSLTGCGTLAEFTSIMIKFLCLHVIAAFVVP
jgi:hypothetical protein